MNKIYSIILVFVTIFAISCEDIFEKNLEKEKVVIISPPNNYKTESLTNTFWWEEIDGTLKYNLQIASPSFDSVETLVLDTNVFKNKFQFTLSPGKFQWRVKAFNGSSETEYTTYTLQVDSTGDLTSQKVVLISPATNFATNVATQIFNWYKIYNANDYRFEIHSTDWNGELLFNPELTQENTLTFTLPDGIYVWGVQAQNSVSASAFTTRSIIIDTQIPNKPTLLTPTYNTEKTDSLFELKWSRGGNSGSSIKDSLYIASDSLFKNVTFATYQTDTIYSWIATQKKTYFWKVKSIDLAGNKSSYSNLSKFIYK